MQLSRILANRPEPKGRAATMGELRPEYVEKRCGRICRELYRWSVETVDRNAGYGQD